MKKFIKFTCLLIIVALIAILVLKNGATADNDGPVTFEVDELEIGVAKNVSVDFGGTVTSYTATISTSDNLSVQGERTIVWDRGPATGASFVVVANSGDEASVTINATLNYQDAGDQAQQVEKTYSGTIGIKGGSTQLEISDSSGNTPDQITLSMRDTASLYSNIEETQWSASPEGVVNIFGGGREVTISPIVSASQNSCTVTATSGNQSDSITVNIEGSGQDDPPVSEFSVSPTSMELYTNQVNSVTVSGGNVGEITSSNSSVATAQANGNIVLITPTGAGSCTITINEDGGNGSATVAVTVKEVEPIPGPEPGPNPGYNDPQPEITAGKTTLLPGGDTTTIVSTGGIPVTWHSSNTNAVAIDKANTTDTQATIISNKAGTAEITARALTGGKTASVIIKVQENEQASPVIGPSSSIKLEAGKSTFVYADQSVTWTSSDSSVATVDGDGLVVAKAEGTAKITAKNKSGKTASITITVSAASNDGGSGNEGGNEGGSTDEPTQSTSTFAISPTKTQRIKEGETLQINVTKGAATSWKSSKPAVATVDKNGKVTANSSGTAIITAVSADGSVAQVKIIVQTEDGKDPTDSEADENVPSTGEASTQLIFVVGAITCVVAMFIFRKKTK